MSIEQRLEQVERQTKRLRIAVVVLATALCSVVSMAATQIEVAAGNFDLVRAKNIIAENVIVENSKSVPLIEIGADDNGHGMIYTRNSKGEELVSLRSITPEGTMSSIKTTVINSDLTLTESVIVESSEGPVAGIKTDDNGNGVMYTRNSKDEIIWSSDSQ